MQKQHLRLITPATPPEPQEDAEPLLHLRITGRHGVFLLQRGEDQIAVVETRTPGGLQCTCGANSNNECEHIAILRACGFMQAAAKAA